MKVELQMLLHAAASPDLPKKPSYGLSELTTSARVTKTGDNIMEEKSTFSKFVIRSFQLPCHGGICSSRELPSCTDDILEWDEEEVGFEKCQEVSFRGASLLCGINGTKEITRKFRLGGGTVEEVVESTSCKDCGDLSAALAWTAWTFCGRAAEAMLCRRRGNADIGFEEEGEL